MGATKKFKITIEQVVKETFEFVLPADNIMAALDEARRMVADRNERSKKIGRFSSVKKIEGMKDE